MNYNISPLAITSVDWKVYSDQVKKILNFDPLKGLGEAYLLRECPSSYLATLDLANQPLKHLRTGPSVAFNHFSVSFIGSIDSELFFDFLCNFPDILTLSKQASKIAHFVIFTADMTIWHHSVRSALSRNNDYSSEIRKLFHVFLINFEQLGFQEVWSKYERMVLADGSLVFT